MGNGGLMPGFTVGKGAPLGLGVIQSPLAGENLGLDLIGDHSDRQQFGHGLRVAPHEVQLAQHPRVGVEEGPQDGGVISQPLSVTAAHRSAPARRRGTSGCNGTLTGITAPGPEPCSASVAMFSVSRRREIRSGLGLIVGADSHVLL